MPHLPEARVAHFTSGRLRVRIPDRRGDESFFETVRQQLGAWQSVERVETNPLTGSVLLHFSDPAALFAENALKNNLFAVSYEDITEKDRPGTSVTEWAAQRIGEADQAMRRWTGNAADIRAVVFVMLAGAGVVQLVRGNIMAPGATLLWYAGAMLRLWDVVPEVKEAVKEG